MRKGMDVSIRLIVVMAILLIIAAILGLITDDYFGMFQVFGSNQTENANFSVF